MNNELIQQARELCEKATPPPWAWDGIKEDSQYDFKASCLFNDRQLVIELDDVYQGYPECGQDLVMQIEKADAAFITASRTLVPQLCDALEAAQKEIEQLTSMNQHNLSCYVSEHDRAEKAEAERDAVIEDFQDFATSGIYNMNPHCGNRCAECTDGRGWCIENYCKGFKVAIEPPKGE